MGAVLGRAVGEGLLLPDVEQSSTALPYLYVGGAGVVPVANGANTPIYFTVTLGAPESSAVTFNFATSNGTAIAEGLTTWRPPVLGRFPRMRLVSHLVSPAAQFAASDEQGVHVHHQRRERGTGYLERHRGRDDSVVRAEPRSLGRYRAGREHAGGMSVGVPVWRRRGAVIGAVVVAAGVSRPRSGISYLGSIFHAGAEERGGGLASHRVACFAYVEPVRARSVASIDATAKALAPSPCHGDSWIFRWSQVEPSPGVYDWSLIDAALAASKPKPVFLRVIAGTQSPSWFPRADEIYVPNEGEGTSGWMPVPWNQTFLSDWGQFIAAYGRHYDGNPQIAIIEGGGDGPEGEADLSGTTPSGHPSATRSPVYAAAIARLIQDFKTAFPHERMSFAGASGPSHPPRGIGSPEAAFLQDVEAAHVTVQYNGLSSLGAWPTRAASIVNTASDGFGYQMLRAVGGSGSAPGR